MPAGRVSALFCRGHCSDDADVNLIVASKAGLSDGPEVGTIISRKYGDDSDISLHRIHDRRGILRQDLHSA